MLTRLKQETAGHHARIEATVDLFHRARSITEYRTLLERLHGFYAPLEARLTLLSEWSAWNYDFAARAKTPLLIRDLNALGRDAADIAALPRCRDLPLLESFAGALGCLYVIEGATLGGQIIARHLWRTLGIDALGGGSFHAGYGSDAGRMWQAFRALVTAYNASAAPDDEEHVIHAARSTFDCLEPWLAHKGVPA